jgi:hypothetical protein
VEVAVIKRVGLFNKLVGVAAASTKLCEAMWCKAKNDAGVVALTKWLEECGGEATMP